MQGYGVKLIPPPTIRRAERARLPAVSEIIEDKFELVFPKRGDAQPSAAAGVLALAVRFI